MKTQRFVSLAILLIPIIVIWCFVTSGLWANTLSWIYGEQRQLQRGLSGSLSELAQHGTITASWALLSASFLYGIIHAAGPGHGKIVLSTYLLTHKEHLRHSLTLAWLSAACQDVVAIVLIYGLIYRAGLLPRETNTAIIWSERASYILIVTIGLWLSWRAAKPLFTASFARHKHHGTHQIHEHDENCGCGHQHLPNTEQLSQAVNWRTSLGIIFSIGMRPCTGAVLVLVLARSLKMPWIGILSTFAMAAGTAITISTLAFLAVHFRNTAEKALTFNTATSRHFVTALTLTGGAVLVFMGASLFLGSLSARATISF